MEKVTIPEGTVLSGNSEFEERRWTVGSFISANSFEDTYEAALHDGRVPAEYSLVVKIVPYENAPLPVEFNFYLDNADSIDIDIWKRINKIDYLGMPVLLGSGSHMIKGQNYQFIVLERYGKDLWSLFLENGRKFEEHTVYKIALQILSILKYIHSRSYVHGDIKASNIVVDVATQNQIYLVNYHFASRYTADDGKVNLENAHVDAVEYMSRDAYKGVLTMRGDLEMLFYNMVQWLGLKFPWDENLKDSCSVQQQKENAFINVEQFLKDWSKKITIPSLVADFMKVLAEMCETDKPTYGKFIKILGNGLKKVYHVPYGNLEFSISNVHADDQIVEDSIFENKSKRRYNLTYIPKLGISVAKLAHIISENCRHEAEVKLRKTGPHSLIQIIYTFIGKRPLAWQNKVASAWEIDEAALKTITKQLWASKAKEKIKNKAASKENVYEETIQRPSTSAQANTSGINCSITSYRSIPETHIAAMSPKETPSLEDPAPLDPPNSSPFSMSRSLLEARSATPFKCDGVQSSLSQPSSRGVSRSHSSQDFRSDIFSPFKSFDQILDKGHHQFGSETQQHEAGCSGEQLTEHHSSTSLDDEQWPSTFAWLNAWLEMKEQILTAFGSIPSKPSTMISQVQQVRVLLDDFRTQNPRICQLAGVLAKLPPESADVQKLNRIQQRWREQLTWLEERGRKLGNASFAQLREALQDASGNLDKLLDEPPEEQLLRKMEILAGQLEGQKALLASAEIVTEQLCQAFSDPGFNAGLQTELQSVNKLYDGLQHRINMKKAEIERSLNEGRQFDDSCKEIIVWLAKELDMSQKLIVLADPEKLHQLQQHYQLVLDKETEVNELLHKGRDFLSRPQNLENVTLQQRLLDLMKTQWDRLRMHSLQISSRLQTCVEHCDEYYQRQNLFIDWLHKTEDKFRHLQPISLSDTEMILKELYQLNNEVREKSGEFEQTMSVGDTFVSACDKNNDDVVKNELTLIKDRWDKLNNDLHERIQSLVDTASRFTVFNEYLNKLQRRVDELAHQDQIREITDPNQLDSTKGLREEADSLRGPFEVVRQLANELVLKANEQRMDASRLSSEIDDVAARIESLKTKLVDNLNKLYEQKIAIFEKDIKPKVQEQDVKPTIPLPKPNWTSGEIIDLSSDNEAEIDFAYEEKPTDLLFNTNTLSDEVIDLASGSESEIDIATRQLGELLSERREISESIVQIHENQLKEAWKNGEKVARVEKFLGEKKRAYSDALNNEREKTRERKRKRRKHQSRSCGSKAPDLDCSKKRMTTKNSERKEERQYPILKNLILNRKKIHPKYLRRQIN